MTRCGRKRADARVLMPERKPQPPKLRRAAARPAKFSTAAILSPPSGGPETRLRQKLACASTVIGCGGTSRRGGTRAAHAADKHFTIVLLALGGSRASKKNNPR